MRNENQWIPLSGPGGRLPNEADGDEFGRVYFARPEYDSAQRDHWYSPESATHFCPIPKAPPLPKPVEKTQDQKDKAMVSQFMARYTPFSEDVIDAIRYGRSDGRAQLARECLAQFLPCNIEGARKSLEGIACFRTADALKTLHALLTKAAGETP